MNQVEYDELKEKFSNRFWRLNNLYYIKNKSGNKVKFRLNWAQLDFYKNMHSFNATLKARQLGFTTYAMIYFLDDCIFNSNTSAGVIAHNLDDAQKLFKDKVKFAWDNLPSFIKGEITATSDSARTLEFSNGSSIYVGTSLRGGTYQKLLISEYGKISAKYPDRANEIKTGALNTVEAGQEIFVESTAEGKVGEFYELVIRAMKLLDSGKKLARLEPKFFFYSWFQNPDYRATDDEIENYTIPKDKDEYFSSLEDEGISLDVAQKIWYCIKADMMGDDMTQEYPSVPEEAFQGSLQGAYYTKQMRVIRERGQICHVPYDKRFPVYTWWDLGTNDLMTIWFYQNVKGRHNFIDYYENNEEGWEHYAKVFAEKGYNYCFHGFPHDGNKRMRGKQLFTDKQVAIECGLSPIKVTPRTDNAHNEVINKCQPILENCFFDEVKCAKGITHLDNYRRRWSKPLGMYMKEALHDEASHGADSFRTFAANVDSLVQTANPQKPKPKPTHGYSRQVSWMS